MRRRGLSPLAIVSILAALTLSAGAGEWTATDDIFKAMKANRVVPPVPAPDVALPGLDSVSIRLADLKGRVVILGFFVTG
jgi:cytochrome oxidase Cu insertion factor (SCO1/SenC/PrrC family)